MKKRVLIFTAGFFILACNNESTDKAKGGDKNTETATSDIRYPFKATYSSDFKMGDANHSKLVLDFMKCWVDNRLDDMRPFLADSVWVEFDGGKFQGPADSIIKTGKQFRARYTSVVSTMDSWMPVHANDKNEDYVLTWGKEIDTDAKGRIDSMRGHSYFQIKNNKISGWSEFTQKLGPQSTAQ